VVVDTIITRPPIKVMVVDTIMAIVLWVSVNVAISEMRVQELPVNKVFRKEIVKGNDRQNRMLINAAAMGGVTLIPIIVTGHITEIVMIPQEL
jgi:hypothetical protein